MPLLETRRGDGAFVPAPERRNRTIDPWLASDLRRRRAPGVIELVLVRAALLPKDDRALLEAIYRDATPARTIASLRGVDPRRVRRRVRLLVQRVLSPRFEFVLNHAGSWAPSRRRVAMATVIEGRSLREASAHLGMTIHTVRRHVEAIRLLERASEHGGDA